MKHLPIIKGNPSLGYQEPFKNHYSIFFLQSCFYRRDLLIDKHFLEFFPFNVKYLQLKSTILYSSLQIPYIKKCSFGYEEGPYGPLRQNWQYHVNRRMICTKILLYAGRIMSFQLIQFGRIHITLCKQFKMKIQKMVSASKNTCTTEKVSQEISETDDEGED